VKECCAFQERKRGNRGGRRPDRDRLPIDKDRKWSQVDAQDTGRILLTVQGERLGTEVVRVSETIRTAL